VNLDAFWDAVLNSIFTTKAIDWFFSLRIHRWAMMRCCLCGIGTVVDIKTNAFYKMLNGGGWVARNRPRIMPEDPCRTEYVCPDCASGCTEAKARMGWRACIKNHDGSFSPSKNSVIKYCPLGVQPCSVTQASFVTLTPGMLMEVFSGHAKGGVPPSHTEPDNPYHCYD